MRQFDRDRLTRARRLRIFRRILGLARLAVAIALLLVLYGVGVAPAIAAAFAPTGAIGRTLLTIVVVLVALWLVGLPLAVAGYRRERAEGLNLQPASSFAADQLKALLVNVVLAGSASAAWYAIVRLPGSTLIIILAAFALATAGVLIGPLLLRVFYRLETVDAALDERVRAVAQRAGIRVGAVRSWRVSEKATIANAVVLGLGPTKQIAIADTLAREAPPEQVEAVVAHELGHVVHGDTTLSVLVYGATLALALLAVRAMLDIWTAEGSADVATYPLLLAGVDLIAVVASPAILAYSRSREAAADAFAARHARPEAMADALVWIAQKNLSDPEPPRWEEILFLSHPSVAARLRALGAPPVSLSPERASPPPPPARSAR